MTHNEIIIVWSKAPQLEARGVNHHGVTAFQRTVPITMIVATIAKAINTLYIKRLNQFDRMHYP
ncbi:MAG TPA: hypothetical protein EYP92_08805 [Candidatus Thioglobus sp.]|nr:hypothetical protein [Candidatus Thioglobus sp.]